MINSIEAANSEIQRILIQTWMTAALEAVMNTNGFAPPGFLVLLGKMGAGKRAWVRRLDPTRKGCADDVLKPSETNNYLDSSKNWIQEIDISGLSKDDFCHLESYVSPTNQNFVCRSAYVATVTNCDFLDKVNDSRNWWIVQAGNIDLQHNLDMQQVWAQVEHYRKQGASPYLTEDIKNMVAARNSHFRRSI